MTARRIAAVTRFGLSALATVLGDEARAKTLTKTLVDWLVVRRGRFRIYGEDALISRPAAPFLAKGRVVRGSLVALVSDPGVGKTFLVLDLALAIAAGRPTWLRAPLRAAGPVLYVIAEGVGRFKSACSEGSTGSGSPQGGNREPVGIDGGPEPGNQSGTRLKES